MGADQVTTPNLFQPQSTLEIGDRRSKRLHRRFDVMVKTPESFSLVFASREKRPLTEGGRWRKTGPSKVKSS